MGGRAQIRTALPIDDRRRRPLSWNKSNIGGNEYVEARRPFRTLCRRPGKGRPDRVRARGASGPPRFPEGRRPRQHGRADRRGDSVPPQYAVGLHSGGDRRQQDDDRGQGRAHRAQRPAGQRRDPGPSAERRGDADRSALHPQQRHRAGRHGPGDLEIARRRPGRQPDDARHRRPEEKIRGRDPATDHRMRRQRPGLLRPAGARQPVDGRRGRQLELDRRAPRRRAQGRRRQAQCRLHRPCRRRHASLRQGRQAADLARRADRQGDEPEQPDRLRHERRAAPSDERRAAAPGDPGLAGLLLAEMAQAHLAARQGP